MPLEQEPRLSFNVPSKWTNRFIAVALPHGVRIAFAEAAPRYSGPDRSPRAADDEWLFSVSWQDDVDLLGGRGSKLMLLAAVPRQSSSRRCCMLFRTRFGVSVAISTETLAPESFLSRVLRRCEKGVLQR
jgi:hypothetical protein